MKNNNPDLNLVTKYNKLKPKQEKAGYRGKKVTLYKPELSRSKTKKLRVYVKDTEDGKIVKVLFGHDDYEDYTTHRDKERKSNYCARSKGIKCGDEKCGVTSPNFWSRMVLWNC